MWLLAAFIAVPLIEIALFIEIGGLMGLWPTLAIVVATAVAGTVLVRSQGREVLGRLQASLDRLDDPTEPLAHGAMILLSGALLLTPGFFTDAVGFALLIPDVRVRMFRALRHRITMRAHVAGRRPHPGHSAPTDATIIDADFEELDPDEVPPRRAERPSNWTRRG